MPCPELRLLWVNISVPVGASLPMVAFQVWSGTTWWNGSFYQVVTIALEIIQIGRATGLLRAGR
jgi:hypothetical protein